jgi:hypothetical protein
MGATVYVVVVVVHIAVAAGLMGSIITEPLLRSMIRSAPSASELRMWVVFERRSNSSHPALGAAVLATGIYLGTFGWWSTAWFAVAVVLWVANATLAVSVLDARAQAVVRLLGQSNMITGELNALRNGSSWDWAVGAMSANDIASLYLMIAKPDVVGALLTVALSYAVFGTLIGYWSGRSGAAGVSARQAPEHQPL